jgi:3-isopropylmalate/(R)-2-methylmalate dehydratase large subunit
VNGSDSTPQTLFDKIWRSHVVAAGDSVPSVLYIDLHLIHEVTSPQAFAGLAAREIQVRRPDRTVATMDHSTPTVGLEVSDPIARAQIETLERNCEKHGIELHRQGSDHHGIVHVIGPELGLTQPGMTVVCGDSHTATHGAFGALAFGIGTSEVEHVLATQCLLQSKPSPTEVRIEGILPAGVTAKDVILALIARIGTGGGRGQVFEYRGSTIRAMDMDQRMTICNMTIEAGARAGMIAPDDTTFSFLAGREHAPRGEAWDRAVTIWQGLATDDGAAFDRSLTLDVSKLEPMVTFGTNPAMAVPISGAVPKADEVPDSAEREALQSAISYMEIEPGSRITNQPVDVVFVGSCTNSRISDMRQAAAVVGGRRLAEGVRMLVVPGSEAVRRQAEAEGLDRIFTEAGAEWRLPGCSMCIAMNGDQLEPGQYAVSTSNRNFEGRQGPNGRTFLASPLTAAASALTGKITDARSLSPAPAGVGLD